MVHRFNNNDVHADCEGDDPSSSNGNIQDSSIAHVGNRVFVIHGLVDIYFMCLAM